MDTSTEVSKRRVAQERENKACELPAQDHNNEQKDGSSPLLQLRQVDAKRTTVEIPTAIGQVHGDGIMVGVYDKAELYCRECKITHVVSTGWESEFPDDLEITCPITKKTWTVR